MEKSLSPILKDVLIVSKTSKAGNAYYILRSVFQDDSGKVYQIDNFINNDQRYILDSMLDNVE